jgi:hypothetical protein
LKIAFDFLFTLSDKGDLTPTLLLFIMGLAVMTFSFVVWKIAEN